MGRPVVFSSILAEYIRDFLAEKRSLGFIYSTEESILLRFDQYCIDNNLTSVNVSKTFLDGWCLRSATEGLAQQRKRISAVRQLMIYMLTLGIQVYLPPKFVGKVETPVPHIFTEAELQSFFYEVDTGDPKTNQQADKRLVREYRVLFRLIYCCGLRNSEASGIATAQVDLNNGVLTILNSKGAKDRLVYMAEDLTELCTEYYDYLCCELQGPSEWFFPRLNPEKPLSISSTLHAFNRYWNRTPFAATCNKKPTVHDLRFTFVTDRINLWALQGVNVDVMMPYLQKYLGHKSLQDTYYYYHNSGLLYESIRQKDKTSDLVIPEVSDYE